MRKLMYIAIGFAAACGVRAYGDGTVMVILAAAVVLLACLVGTNRYVWKRCLLALLGCVLGVYWFGFFRSSYLEPVLPMDGQRATLSVRAIDFGEPEQGFTFFDGLIAVEERTYLIHVRLKGEVDVEPGMVFSGTYSVSVPEGNTYNSGKGSFLYAYQREITEVSHAEDKWYDQLAVIRRQVRTAIKEAFPEDTYPFALALFLVMLRS